MKTQNVFMENNFGTLHKVAGRVTFNF